jgi:hypothetical protein
MVDPKELSALSEQWKMAAKRFKGLIFPDKKSVPQYIKDHQRTYAPPTKIIRRIIWQLIPTNGTTCFG